MKRTCLALLTLTTVLHLIQKTCGEDLYGVKDVRCSNFEPNDETAILYLPDETDCSKFYKVRPVVTSQKLFF